MNKDIANARVREHAWQKEAFGSRRAPYAASDCAARAARAQSGGEPDGSDGRVHAPGVEHRLRLRESCPDVWRCTAYPLSIGPRDADDADAADGPLADWTRASPGDAGPRAADVERHRWADDGGADS